VEVSLADAEAEEAPGSPWIAPLRPPRVIGEEDPLLRERDLAAFERRRAQIYGTDEPYPAQPVEVVRTGGFRRYRLVDVRVTPFAWRPQSRRLVFYRRLVLRIEVAPADGSAAVIEDYSPRMERVAQRLILNYDQALGWYGRPAAEGRSEHDLVIITTAALEPVVAPLVQWEQMKGRSPAVVTVEWIAGNVPGVDLAQQMGNFLRERYPTSQWGIEDVLFVGHHNEVPMRKIWQELGYGKPRTDFYFAELSAPDSQSWDANNNGRYGEDNDPIDYYAEVNVGRFPYSDADTVAAICAKTIAFEQNDDPTYKKNIMVLGAFFWDDTDTAVLMEAKIDQPWMTDWLVTRMYEKNSQYYSSYDADYDLRHSTVMDVWPDGRFAFVNWAGHGAETSSHILGRASEAFITAGDSWTLGNDYPSIIFADSCSNSDTEANNIGRAMLGNGAVGFVGATKVAFGSQAWDDPMDGSSQSMDYYFTTAMTSTEYRMGEALQYGLSTNYQNGGWYYVTYEVCEWTLWGNPALSMGPWISRKGQINLDRDAYAPGIEAAATVVDLDLDQDPGMIESVEVTYATDSGDEEVVELQETGFHTARFTGGITLVEGSAVPGNGVLEVVHEDELTVTYVDADDGHGGFQIPKTDTAMVDAVAPVISGVEVLAAGQSSLTIHWVTDEPADSRVTYGAETPEETVVAEPLVNFHFVTLEGLEPCTSYVFYVSSGDAAGNVSVDDNGGANYSGVTEALVVLLEEDMSVDPGPGWVSSGGDWAWGVPAGQGGEHGCADPASGHTGASVYGYNLQGDYPNNMPAYTLTMPPIDCREVSDVRFGFQRWLGVERNIYDHAAIQVSTDGVSWEEVWANPEVSIEDCEWRYVEYDISAIADGQESVWLRWVLGPTDQGWRYCGWNIDDVRVFGSAPCDLPTATPPPPTATPSPTPSPRPTATMTPSPGPTEAPLTATPLPGTGTPAPTATPMETTGVTIWMPATQFQPGDPCACYAYVTNAGPVALSGHPLFVILDVFGAYFFGPSFEERFDNYLGLYPEFPPGTTEVVVVPEFTWPAIAGHADGLTWYAALTDPAMTRVVGTIGTWTFGW